METSGNTKYMSKTQNDLLTDASATIVEQNLIVEEIKRAESYSIIADETRDISRTEQLSMSTLCSRYGHPDDHFIKVISWLSKS